jgi:hypothetical protein
MNPQPAGRTRRRRPKSTFSAPDDVDVEALARAIAMARDAAEEWLGVLGTIGLSDEIVDAVIRNPVAAKAFGPMAFIALAAEPGDEDSFSPRLEANVLVAMAIRNGPIENYHYASRPLGDTEMKELTVSASRRLNAILQFRNILLESGPDGQRAWRRIVVTYHRMYCAGWETADVGESPM